MKTVALFFTVISAIVSLTATLTWFTYKDDISFMVGFYSILSASLFFIGSILLEKRTLKKNNSQQAANTNG